MKQDGHGLIFISHKLREVLAISDRITVLRGGRNWWTRAQPGRHAGELARMMVGREVLLERTRTSRVELGAVQLGPARRQRAGHHRPAGAARCDAGSARRRNFRAWRASAATASASWPK
jgi:ABC-type sugar transport system ATPase subunit